MGHKVIFAGCSYTAGNGWVNLPADQSLAKECKDSPYLWVNLCHKTIPRIRDLELVNIGRGSASNTDIFENSVRSISSLADEIDIMVCQWTSVPRYNFYTGFELWNMSESLQSTEVRKHDIILSKGDHWPREYIRDLLDRLRVMHHLHWDIVKIIDYSATLSKLAKQIGFDIFFVNGMCPWDTDYFTRLRNVDPEQYTPFTKKEILNIDSRDDQSIFKLYNLAHDHYQEAGGLDAKQWINLYGSFANKKIDTNFDLMHPGEKSNVLYCNLMKDKLAQI